jgi:hypothetical protein
MNALLSYCAYGTRVAREARPKLKNRLPINNRCSNYPAGISSFSLQIDKSRSCHKYDSALLWQVQSSNQKLLLLDLETSHVEAKRAILWNMPIYMLISVV